MFNNADYSHVNHEKPTMIISKNKRQTPHFLSNSLVWPAVAAPFGPKPWRTGTHHGVTGAGPGSLHWRQQRDDRGGRRGGWAPDQGGRKWWLGPRRPCATQSFPGAAERKDKDDEEIIWPDIEVVYCWTGTRIRDWPLGTYERFRKKYEDDGVRLRIHGGHNDKATESRLTFKGPNATDCFGRDGRLSRQERLQINKVRSQSWDG